MAIKAKLDGKIARTGELKQSAKGDPYYSFAVGVFDNKENKTEYVQCVAFGEVASQIAILAKGDDISATGMLKLNEYTSKDGFAKQALNLTIDKFLAL